ncbi:hypothetical protein PMAYCL1PPCAC_17213, partial [Pristionchus mayeri]
LSNRVRVDNFPMAEDDQVHGRLPDELAERLGQAPLSEARHPGSGRRKSLSPLPSRINGVCNSRMRCQGGRGRLLSELAPFMNLLPAEIILSEMKDQELLRTILQDVGRHAYSHLVKYLNSRPGPLNLGSTLNDFIPPPPNQLSTDQMVMLSECLDDAVDSIRDLANHPNFKDTGMLNHASRETIPQGLREAVCVEMITPEMAATALTLLTASAFRRPPTRMVEGMMAASQEAQTNAGEGDSQREGTETADETTVPPPPASDDSLLGLACSTGLWELAMLMVRVRQSGDFMGEAECTPLMEACAAGHEKIVRQMIPYAADLNTQSATQNTALIYASAAGHLDCVEALLEAGATRGIDIDLKNENGHCALMEAASGGHLEIVKRLIEAGSGSLRMNVNSEFKESPLTLAAYKGHSALVAYLLTLDLGETREEELHTALMEASMDGHIQVAEILLKAGAPVNLPSDSFESPLTLAACGGHTELVKLLIDSGASIEEPNDESYTPLMEAAREGHADVVRLLLEAGACVNATTEETGETAMTLAACGGFTEIVEMILESGGDLEAGANTPLMEAATEGHQHTAEGIIRMMKEHKLDKDTNRLPIIIDHVSTALVQAADNGHYQIVRDIATSGFVDLNFQLENRTPLMKAAKGGYRDIIRFLVQGGADVNVRSASNDVTALSLACAGGHYDTVAELLQAGADPNVILKDGVTCVLEAARHGYVHIVELLLDYRDRPGAGSTGPKPNRKVATPRRTVTAARKAASAAAAAVAGPVAAAAGVTDRSAISKVDEMMEQLMEEHMKLHFKEEDYDYEEEEEESPCEHLCPHHQKEVARARQSEAAAAEFIAKKRPKREEEKEATRQSKTDEQDREQAEREARRAQLERIRVAQEARQAREAALPEAERRAREKRMIEKMHAFDERETARGNPRVTLDGVGPLVLNKDGTVTNPLKAEGAKASPTAVLFSNGLGFIRTEEYERLQAEKAARTSESSVDEKNELSFKWTTTAEDPLDEAAFADCMQMLASSMQGEIPSGIMTAAEKALTCTIMEQHAADENKEEAIRAKEEAIGELVGEINKRRAANAARDAARVAKATSASTKDGAAPQPAPVSAAGTAPAAGSMASAAAIAAAVAAAPGKTREERVANAAAAAAARSRDPGAQASDMMKTMANHLPMPTKDQTTTPSQMASFHRFHNFLVRTAKGENPPQPTMAAAMAEAAAMMPPPPAGSAPLYTSAEASAIMVDALTAAASPGALSAADAATVAAAIATAAAARIGINAPSAGPMLDMSDWMDSPSPCPSSPALLPLMTASSDEFVSETRTPVHVKRRSASVPHERTNARWPCDSMMRLHEQECQQVIQQLKKSQQQPPSGGGTKGDAVPPPSKRPTGPNRQGASRTGTVEKRPLAAVTSTFDVDMQTESNNDTPLTLACSNGHTAMVELLVQRGANVHHKDKKGFTPLILAATGGHLCIVRILLDHGANIETTSERTKDTALSLACSGGKKDVVEFLLKRGANKEHRNVSDYTPLSLAASGGYVDICNMLLDAGAEINSRTGSKLGISPLMLAAMNGHKEATRVLLERGSDINAQIETNRNTALTLACFQVCEEGERGSCGCCMRLATVCREKGARRDEGRTEVVRLLLQYNANVEHRAKTGLTPLMEAANGGYVEVGQLLLEAYADPNTAPVPSSRDTALTIAADKGHEKFVDLLLKNGAAVDARNKKGCTALWLACHGGHLETVMTLVKHKKTNVEMEDNRKVSPLMIAFRKGHTKIVKFLVKWVSQFPGDAELCRYIQTVTEQDLMTRCHECMNTIVTAKDKQAAQANLAADALIAQIEAEEEQARSKKLKKQRQKEKKTAKKQEKKKQEEVKEEESEDEEEEAPEVVEPPKQMPKEEPKKEEAAPPKQPPAEKAKGKAGKQAAASTPLAAAVAAKGKARAAAAAAATAASAARTPIETTPEREVEKVEERIPGLNLPPAAPTVAPVVEEPAPSARKTAADRRAANRRSRNESGKNNGTPSSVPSQPLPSLMATPALPPASLHSQQMRSSPSTQQQQQPISLLSPLTSPRGTGAVMQEEWVKPNKKGRNAKTGPVASGAARSNSATEKQKLTDPTEENALAMWNNIEASRRRMTTLQVSSPCIARVIGRGGANINAIREATGASIEVERVDKALSRRDNIDREICIRGTQETVKNAVAMINGLIAETDVTVNEIIRLVRNSASPSDQPRLSDSHGIKMAAATTATAGSGGGRGASSAAAGAPASTTNVWQQRMAARQAQDAALRPAAPAAPAAAPVQRVPTAASPVSTTRSDASSPVTTRASTPPRAPAAEQHATDEQKQPEAVEESTQQQAAAAAPVPAPIGPPPTATAKQQQEEQERKAVAAAAAQQQQQRMAPGYARPATLNNNSTPTAVAASHGSAPASPAPTRPTALPSTPLHQQQHRSLENNEESRVPDLAPHMLSFGDANESRDDEETRGSSAPFATLSKQDSASALFNDSTFKSLAEIWGDSSTGGGDAHNSSSTSGAFGSGAWDNALLLNSFNSISLSKPDWTDFSTSSSSVLDSSSASARGNGASNVYSSPSSLHHTTSLGSVAASGHLHHPQMQQQH